MGKGAQGGRRAAHEAAARKMELVQAVRARGMSQAEAIDAVRRSGRNDVDEVWAWSVEAREQQNTAATEDASEMLPRLMPQLRITSKLDTKARPGRAPQTSDARLFATKLDANNLAIASADATRLTSTSGAMGGTPTAASNYLMGLLGVSTSHSGGEVGMEVRIGDRSCGGGGGGRKGGRGGRGGRGRGRQSPPGDEGRPDAVLPPGSLRGTALD